jgi:hypothetical protein
MALRSLLLLLVLAAAAAFIVGVGLERGNESAEHKEGGAVSHVESGEAAGESHAEGSAHETGLTETHAELRPLGVDVEAWPFVALAALVSVGLAVAVWRHPDRTALLAVMAGVTVLFAALDAREVVHQSDLDESGLAVLAGVVALLHLAAAAVAAMMVARVRRTAPPGRAGTMPT